MVLTTVWVGNIRATLHNNAVSCQISTMKVTLFAGLVILPLLTALAGPVRSRQEDSQTDYTGYTLEGCDNMFAVCKGHLAHPGHVPGGMKQCQSEMSTCVLLLQETTANTAGWQKNVPTPSTKRAQPLRQERAPHEETAERGREGL